jgi:hypothetical protein
VKERKSSACRGEGSAAGRCWLRARCRCAALLVLRAKSSPAPSPAYAKGIAEANATTLEKKAYRKEYEELVGTPVVPALLPREKEVGNNVQICCDKDGDLHL